MLNKFPEEIILYECRISVIIQIQFIYFKNPHPNFPPRGKALTMTISPLGEIRKGVKLIFLKKL